MLWLLPSRSQSPLGTSRGRGSSSPPSCDTRGLVLNQRANAATTSPAGRTQPLLRPLELTRDVGDLAEHPTHHWSPLGLPHCRRSVLRPQNPIVIIQPS